MSSISPIATKEVRQEDQQALGCDYLDAPVSGGEVGAKAASLTIMVGGSQEAFERSSRCSNDGQEHHAGRRQRRRPDHQGRQPDHRGAEHPGGGEALLFASKAGADPAKVREALMGGFAASRILEVHGERMVKRTFAPGFRIALHQKDLNLALQGAKSLGIALPNTAMAQELMNACAAQRLERLDHSALCRAIEIMSNHAIAAA
jgi:2-hydroxy-3-oxopropionate reductase